MQKRVDEERVVLAPRVRYRAVSEEGVLVHLTSGRVLVVNEVGLHVLRRLAEPRTRSELAESVTEEFDVTADQAEADLATYLAELDAEQVLERAVTPD